MLNPKTLLTQDMDQASGNNCQGIVGCITEGLDSRMAEVNTRTENTENACLEAEFS